MASCLKIVRNCLTHLIKCLIVRVYFLLNWKSTVGIQFQKFSTGLFLKPL